MNLLIDRIQDGTSSRLKRVLLGEQLPLMPRLGLFVLFTILLIFLTIILLPKLVVLGPWGYVAGFTINCLSSALVVLPGPGFAALIIMTKELDPFLLGIAAGIGGTFGELTGYWLGAQGSKALEGNRVHALILRAMNHLGGGILLCFGLIPFLPVDAAGVLAGASGYPVSKFLIYVGIGKILMSVTILYLAARAFEWAEPYLMWLG
jgi:membrane protein YqaA with SNARE-associated domain